MLFWQVFDGELVLNDIGRMMKEVIDQIPEHYPGINVEISVIIPIPIHILFLIADVVAGPRAYPRCSRCRGDACVASTSARKRYSTATLTRRLYIDTKGKITW